MRLSDPHVAAAICHPNERSKFLLILRLAIFTTAFALSCTGLILFWLIQHPRCSSCERAKNDFVIFTFSPALCHLLKTGSSFSRWSLNAPHVRHSGSSMRVQRMLIIPLVHSSSLGRCLDCCTIPSGRPDTDACRTTVQWCTVVWKLGSSKCGSSPC